MLKTLFKERYGIRAKNLVIPGDRRHLLQLLIQVYNEQKDSPPPLFEAVTSEVDGSVTSRESFKQQILDQFLSRAVPASFAMLNDSDRALLSLCEANHLSSADAALILGGDSDAISLQLIGARKRLEEKVMANAPPVILDILNEHTPDEWIPRALNQTLKTEFPHRSAYARTKDSVCIYPATP